MNFSKTKAQCMNQKHVLRPLSVQATMCKIRNFARKMGGCKFNQINVFLASRDYIQPLQSKISVLGPLVGQLWRILDRKIYIFTTKMADIKKVPLCSSVQGCLLCRVSLEVHRSQQPKFPALRRSPKIALLSSKLRSSEPTAFLAK